MSMFHELMMRKKEEIMYATIKGNPTESPSGVFSGFSANNYLKTSNNIIINQSSDFEIVVKINISVFADLSAFIGTYGYYGIVVRTGVDYKFHCSIGNGSSWLVSNLATNSTFSVNTDYFFKLTIKNGVITIFSSLDGNSWIEEGTTTVTLSEINTPINLGIGRINTTYFNGSIDLNNSYIKLGSTKYKLQAVVGYTIVGSPTITDGVVSGFSSGNYIYTSNTINNKDITEFVVKIKIPSFALGQSAYQNVYSGCIALTSYSGASVFQYSAVALNGIGDLSLRKNLAVDTDYWIKYTSDGINCSSYWSTDGVNYTLGTTGLHSAIISQILRINFGCRSGSDRFFGGSIDLKETYIKVNGKLWFNGQPS